MVLSRHKPVDITTTAISNLTEFKNQFGISDLHKSKHLSTQADGCNEYQFVRKDNLLYDYKLNNCNFRGNNWDLESTKPKIGFFGCSFTFGEMVHAKRIFPTLVANSIGYNGFNFGVPASSVQRIGRSFSAANKLFDFDYAVITLPDWNRINYLNDDNRGVRYMDLSAWSMNSDIPHEITADLRLYQSLSVSACVQRLIDTVDWMLDIAQYKSTKVILSTWSDEMYFSLTELYPEYTIEKFPIVDTVADNDHPAEQSHQRYADMIVRRINELT